MKSKASKNCRRKAWFSSQQRARAVGSLKMAEGQQWPYECDVCGKWHLTSQPQPGVKPVGPMASGIFS